MPEQTDNGNSETDSATHEATPAAQSRFRHFLSSSKYAGPLVFALAFAVIGTATLLYTHAASTSATGPVTAFGAKWCLDNEHAQFTNNNTVWLYTCNGTSAQQWTLPGDGTIRLDNNKYCLDVANGSAAAKTPVDLYACDGEPSQQWSVKTSGNTSTIINTQSNFCLDDQYQHQTNGNVVWMYVCNGTSAQQWSVPKASTSPTPTPTPTPAPVCPTGDTGTPPNCVAPTPTPTPTGSLPAPTWADEFQSNAVSWASTTGGGNWRSEGYESGSATGGHSDYAGSSYDATEAELQKYDLATEGNGMLSLKAMRNPGIAGVSNKWVGSYLVSNDTNNLTWRYGYFEWRMQLPNPAQGMFPALWLYNNVPGRSTGYQGAELDMLEVFGNSTGQPWLAGIHFAPLALAGSTGRNVATTNNDTAGWHRYAINWTPTSITYYKDGVAAGTVTGAQAAWYNNANLGIRMDYVMDPNWLGGTSENSTTTNPAVGTEPTMNVSYVRYYSTMPANLPTGSADPDPSLK
jgi:hypothetical protein